ncbi:hypothetical protein BKA65DRAFT_573408 [Rhexocercosporidium sp. MPI-PUGE-AT-0058]|nr:hypothetical protein BKA65DRAFT_573408 [Rhexocercosporidium sp. MPI-PUGE-AT-0058]
MRTDLILKSLYPSAKMTTVTAPTVEVSKAMILVTAICDSLEDLISDYGILVGAFPIDNPQIRNEFSLRGFETSKELFDLEDRARTLRSRIAKAEKRYEYGQAARIRHSSERQEISMTFLEFSKSLRDLKKHLEATYPFKYSPGCLCSQLGELGTPSTKPAGLAGEHQTRQIQNITAREPSMNPRIRVRSLSNKTKETSELAPDDAVSSDLMQSFMNSETRSAKSGKSSKRSTKKQSSTKSTKRNAKSVRGDKLSRPRRRATMGIAEKIANTSLRMKDFSFGVLAPEITTPQQIWEHRFPKGSSLEDTQDETVWKLKAAVADKSKLAKELEDARAEIIKLKTESLNLTERTKHQERKIVRFGGILGDNSKPRNSHKRHIHKTAKERHHDKDAEQDFDPSNKRRRIS